MSTAKWYRVTLKDELEKNSQLNQGLLAELTSWLQQEPHLPPMHDLDLVMFLHACHYDVEWAKKTIETNHGLRSKAAFFKARDPSDEVFIACTAATPILLMDSKDNSGNNLAYVRCRDSDLSKYSCTEVFKYSTMMMDVIRLEEGTAPGIVWVMDASCWTLMHVILVPLNQLRHYLQYIQEGTTLRIRSIHFIRCKGSIIDRFMALIRPFLNQELKKVLFFHGGEFDYREYGIPAEAVPEDYGGTAPTAHLIQEETQKKLLKYKDYFQAEQSERIDESKRPRRGLFGWF